MKGGKICEVVCGKRIGKFAQVPNSKQRQEFLDIGKVFVDYFEDNLGTIPVIENGQQITGLTSFDNLKVIGFYS